MLKNFKTIICVIIAFTLIIPAAYAYSDQSLQAVMYMDDFETGSLTPNWTVTTTAPKSPTIQGTDNKVLKFDKIANSQRIKLNNASWGDTSVSVDVFATAWNKVSSESPVMTMYLKYVSDTSNIALAYVPSTNTLNLYRNGEAEIIATYTIPVLTDNVTHNFTFEYKSGINFRLYIDGKIIFSALDAFITRTPVAGTVAFASRNQEVSFDNVVIKKAENILYDNFDGGIIYPVDATGATINTSQKYPIVIGKRGTSNGFIAETDGVRNVLTHNYPNSTTADSSRISYNYHLGTNVPYNAEEGLKWTNIMFSTKMKSSTWNMTDVDGFLTMLARATSATSNYKLTIVGRTLRINKQTSSTNYLLATSPNQTATLLSNEDGVYHDIAFEVKNNANGTVTLNGYIDWNLVVTATDDGVTNGAIIPGGGATIFTYGKFNVSMDEIMIKDMNTSKTSLDNYMKLDKLSLAADNTVTANIYLTNKTPNPKSAVVLIVLYRDNQIVGISPIQSASMNSNNDSTLTTSVTLPNSIDGVKLKALLWDGFDIITPIDMEELQ